jgi:hypothetical protein
MPMDSWRCYGKERETDILLLRIGRGSAMPQDQTIGAEFKFVVYSHRWGRDDTYRVRRTADGWEVSHSHPSLGGPCDKRGEPYLFKNFRQDSIRYPQDVGQRMESLWERARSQGLSPEDVQAGLNEIAQAVVATEKKRKP